ncbi:MAG: hypothetical protein ACXVR1_09775 [Solirubrobacteraceae bacterium]
MGSAIGNRALGRIVRDPARVRGRGLTPGGALRARVVARQPTTTTTTTTTATTPRDAKHPENFATYEEWLGSLGALATFQSHDKAPKGPEASFTVLGDKAASRDPKAPQAERPAPPIGPRASDKFIDHPTDAWVQANLPAELRETAYRLPADCADIAVILRHVWLFAHGRNERYGGFVVGFIPGEAAGARSRRVLGDITGIDTPQLPMMVAPYTDSSGKPLRSFVALAPLLHPGDILVWAHHAGPKGAPPDPTRPRSGGHSQTIASIERDEHGVITKITCLQGNQPLPKESGEDLRHGPGRRIEVSTHDEVFGLSDLTLPATKLRPAERVWDFGDGHTTLVVAGPPRSGGDRPPAKKEGGKTVRRIVDWLPAIAGAERTQLEGRFEAAMREAQTMLERGDPMAEVEGEARTVANATRLRLAALDAQREKTRKPPDPSVGEGIRATLKVKRTGLGSTAPDKLKRVFTAVAAAFEGTRAQAGWKDARLTAINFGERMVGHMRRVPLDGLPAGAEQAIVVLPASVTGGPDPLDVLVHFHGFNTGNKAGRDVSIDRVEAQLESSGRRMMAILPQGTTKADFGTFDPGAYVKAVFAKLTAIGVWDTAPPPGALTLSGHSGGGREVSDLLTAGTTGALAEVALFDGINGPDELKAVEAWVTAQLDKALVKLTAAGGDRAAEDATLRALVRFRAYHSGSTKAAPSRRKLDYPGLHATLRATIEQWLADHASQLSANAQAGLRDHFQVISTGQREHDLMVSGQSRPGSKTGTLEDALTAAKP